MSEIKGEKLINYWLMTSVELRNHENVNFLSVFFLVVWPGPTYNNLNKSSPLTT